MKNIAVIGAGIMGSDVAFELALNDYKVILNDLSKGLLDESKERIRSNFKMMAMMKKDLKFKVIEDIFQNIEFTTSLDGIGCVDLVIENISEDYDKKKKLYLKLDDVTDDSVIYAVNTSCISITQIASLVKKTDRVIGLHFMNPVYMKTIAEVILGFHTSQEVREEIDVFLNSLGKTAIVVNDYPGFVANRVSHLFMNEAAYLVHDQVADPKSIDGIFKKGYGHSMGPLETADLIGLDTVVNSLKILYESYQDSKFRCCPLLQKMTNAGLLGRKSGEGFYKYN